MTDHDESIDGSNALIRLTDVVEFIAALMAIAAPTSAAALGLVGAGTGATGKVVEHFQKRRAERQYDRLHRTLRVLLQKTANIEQELSEEEIDLFIEVVRKLLEDDEEAKADVYAVVLEWIRCEHPTAVEVRILSDAVRSLSYLEIYAFIKEIAGEQLKPIVEPVMDIIVFRNRLSGAGLSQGGSVTVRGSPTRLGNILAKYCKLEDLQPPK